MESFGKTKVTVKMRVHPLVTVFMFLWFGGVGIGCFAVMVSMWGNQNVEAISLIPFGMLIFGYTLFTGGFKYESTKSKKYFAELFEADIEE